MPLHKRVTTMLIGCLVLTLPISWPAAGSSGTVPGDPPLFPPLFNDGHVHLTNYVQEGVSAQKLLSVMGTQVGRATLFGLPLQQQWSYRVTGKNAPTYYLQTDAPLYYYSFTDAWIASAYLSPWHTGLSRRSNKPALIP